MSKFDFTLVSKRDGAIQELPEPSLLNIPVNGLTVSVKRGKAVEQGGTIAKCPSMECADALSPVAGKVMKLSFAYVSVKPSGDEAAVEPVDLSSIEEQKELVRTLRSLGLDTRKLHEAELLIVNGLNTEPGISATEAIMAEEADVLVEGLALVRRLVGPTRCVVAAAEKVALGDCEFQSAKPVYPNSVDELVVKAVTGKENPGNAVVIDVPTLWAFGKVASTGMPLTETIATVNGTNYRIKVGTPLSHVLKSTGQEAREDAIVRLGGPMRGIAAYSLEQGIPAGCTAIEVVQQGEYEAVENVPCINCGECVLACPARLMPNMITRYAEFDLFDDCRTYGIDVCFDCGMCAASCTARRPLLHLIRFAKEQLRMQKDA